MSLDDLLRQAEDRSSPARLARLRVVKVHADRLRATIKAVREEASRADASWRADRATIQTAAMLAELEESARALARLDGVDTDSAARNPYWLAKLCKGLCAALDAAYVEPAPNVFWASWCAIDAARAVRWSPKVEAELDAAYAEWRKTVMGRAPKRLRIIPPPTRPIPTHLLVRASYWRWRPTPRLWRWLDAQVAEPPARPDGRVRLLVGGSDLPRASQSNGRSRVNAETEAIRDALAEPRALVTLDDPGELDVRLSALYRRFPWFGAVLTALRRDLSRHLGRHDGAIGFAPFVLAGPPGVGKTRFVRAFAEAFGLAHRRVDATFDAARSFLGTATGWASETPAEPTRFLASITAANALVFIDELDKEPHETRHATLSDGLLALIEPESARAWRDPALLQAVDLSHLSWAISVNDEGRLTPALRSRLAVYRVGHPRPEHFDALLDSILSDAHEEDVAAMTPALRDALRRRFERDRLTPRDLRRIVEGATAPEDGAPLWLVGA